MRAFLLELPGNPRRELPVSEVFPLMPFIEQKCSPSARLPLPVSPRLFTRDRFYRRTPFILLGYTIIGLALTCPPAAAQDDPAATIPLSDAESILERIELTDEAVAYGEQFLLQLELPLDLNAATADELAQLPLLSPTLAFAIVRYRSRNGPFTSYAALRHVPGMTGALLTNLRPYLTTRKKTGQRATATPPGNRHARVDVIHSIRYTEDGQAGPNNPTGSRTLSPHRTLTRLSARSGRRYALNVTMENDPGERFRWAPATKTYGYDFVSGHAALHDLGRLQMLVLGDYALSFGQGLTFWRGRMFGKGGDPVRSIARSGAGISPYRSSNEHHFFRGFAARVRMARGLSASVFASWRMLDAALTDERCPDYPEGRLCIEGLSTTGLHRSGSELERRHVLGSRLAGGGIEYTTNRFRLGAVGYSHRFAHDFQAPKPGVGEHPGSRLSSMVSVYGHLSLGPAYLFAETSHGVKGALGRIGGVQLTLPRSAELILLARHYPARYRSRYGFAFGERNGSPQNETGYYVGIRLHPHSSWTLAGYFDQYRHPWLRHGVRQPSRGYDGLFRLSYHPRRWMAAYVQARYENEETGAILPPDAAGRILHGLAPRERAALRLHAECFLSDHIRVRSRVEVVRHTQGGIRNEGFLLYGDVRWAPSSRFRIDLRLAHFDTGHYDARIYTYENDVAYTISVPALYGRGRRMYAVASGRPLGWLLLQVKYAVTQRDSPPGDAPVERKSVHTTVRVTF